MMDNVLPVNLIKNVLLTLYNSTQWPKEEEERVKTERREREKTGRGTGSKGENNPPWPGRNSPVQFPAGSLTSHCVCMDVCVYMCVFPAGLFQAVGAGDLLAPAVV